MNMQKQLEEKRYRRDAHARWQNTRIQQFSYVNYLILTFTLAVLGFAADFWTSNDTAGADCWIFWVSMLCSLFLLLLSIFLGIGCAMCRLCDYRKTTEIARLNSKVGGKCRSELAKKIRRRARILGKRSWHFLAWQVGTFVVGLIFLAVVIVKNTL